MVKLYGKKLCTAQLARMILTKLKGCLCSIGLETISLLFVKLSEGESLNSPFGSGVFTKHSLAYTFGTNLHQTMFWEI